MTTTFNRNSVLALCLLFALGAARAVQADVISWDLPGGGNWDFTSTNWTPDPDGRDDGLYANGDNVSFSNTNGGTINIVSNVAPGSTTVNATSGTYTFTGANITSGNLTKSGGGTLVLNSQYTGSGTISIGSGGTIRLGASDRISNTALVTGGGTLDMNGMSESLRWGSGSSFHIINIGDLTIVGPTHSNGDRSGSSTIMSGPGSVTFGAGHTQSIIGSTLTYTGGTFVNNGTLALYGNRTGAQLPATGDVTVAAGATLNLNWHNTALAEKTIGALFGNGAVISSHNNTGTTIFRLGNGGGDGVFDGVYSGAGSLVKLGSGTQVLNGNNTYAGTTTVDAGTLIVNGTTGPNQGNYTVFSGATLGGSGTINLATGNSVTIESGGTLSPGNSGGTLTINGDLVLAGGSILQMELGSPGDFIDVDGLLDVQGPVMLDVSVLGAFDVPYALVQWNTASGVTLDNFILLGGGNLSIEGNSLFFTPIIPEPSTALLLALGGMALIARPRRRRNG